MDTRLHRRHFLALATAGLSLPIASNLANWAQAEETTRPVRLLTVYIPHGAPVEYFDPLGSVDNFDFRTGSTSILADFESLKSQMLIMRGLEIKNTNNHVARNAVFTGNPNGGVSLDQWVAQKTQRKSHLLGVIPDWSAGGLSSDAYLFHDGNAWIPTMASPIFAYDSLFPKSSPSEEGVNPREVLLRWSRKNSKRELESLKKKLDGISRESNKIAAHLEALERLDGNSSGSASGCGTFSEPSSVAQLRSELGGNQSSEPFFQHSRLAQVGEAMIDIASQAMLCGSTVLGLQFLFTNNPVPFQHLSISGGHHDPISHSSDTTGRKNFAKCQRWMYGQIARLAQSLKVDDPLDPGRTVLDNSVILIQSEIADGVGHTCRREAFYGATSMSNRPTETYVPSLLLGGGGGQLRGGRILDFQNRSHGDLLLTLANICGATTSSFGTSGSNPITEVHS